ncbi:MAG: TPM domain-containing protein [Candidatus Omnitrophica bacterium]|nr:TPM domain-containing protein [Candidatus Omnitrophota bacterium]
MRKIFLTLAFLILTILGYAQNVPQPAGWVNDFAGVIDKGNADKLSSLIEEVEQKTTTEIAVVTINSISPYDEKEYARVLFDNWKPGKKGKDNGVLVLLAVKERRWRIETGYGVEGILPDGRCGEIGRNYMVPYLKEGKYGEGLYQGIRAIANIIANDAHVTFATLGNFEEITAEKQTSSTTSNDLSTLIIIIVIIVFIVISNRRAYRKYGGNYYGGSWGGGFGGGGGGGGGFGGGGGGGGGAGGGF